jgi:multimeric flavodoxin WrbA
MPITVLGFAGSPRRHGNSETLLDWVLEAMAAEPGVTVAKVVVVDAHINPCRGCNACERTGACVQHDGMIPLYDRILEVDCVVLAAPIYCMGLAAQTKALVDRAQVYRSRKYVLGWPVIPEERKGKRLGLFLATAGQPWDHVFDAALPSVKCFYHVSGIRDRDMRYLLVNSVDEPGAVEHHPTAWTSAVALGQSAVATLRERLGS